MYVSYHFRNLPLENLIDDVFISDERLERDSATHKLLNGTFTDPFKDIEEDCTEINLDALKHYAKDIWEKSNLGNPGENEDEEQQNTKKFKKTLKEQKTLGNKDSHVADTRKLPPESCKESNVNATQQTPTQKYLYKTPAMVKQYEDEMYKSSNVTPEISQVKKQTKKNQSISKQAGPHLN